MLINAIQTNPISVKVPENVPEKAQPKGRRDAAAGAFR